uniref:LIM domain-containing protein n=1 Tax=Eptatretus burgeri TaxID=7764 RepID=A0A8C4QX56_EPTBU
MTSLKLQGLQESELYRRRHERQDEPNDTSTNGQSMNPSQASCTHCHEVIRSAEPVLNSCGQLYHPRCFVCAQCFQPFPDELFYEYDGRRYCENDFKKLYAPICATCVQFIIGRVIKALGKNWHPECFRCQNCKTQLSEIGFVGGPGRHLCRPCHAEQKALDLGCHACHRCQQLVEGRALVYKGDYYHPDHFNCHSCRKELTSDARELGGHLYCLPCHDKQGVPVCAACHRPIEGRVINAMGKQWHVEHFVCTTCEKPFRGQRHFERRGLAYCETHYNQLFGDVCYHCNHVIDGDVVSALNKAWCIGCFSCSICNVKLSRRSKFVEFDMKLLCKKCYEKFPLELKKRLKKLAAAEKK